MSIFEYLFERKNPGNVGSIEKNELPIKKVSTPILLLKLFISIIMVYGLFYVTVRQNFNFINMMIFIIILFSYCLASYKFIPKPDTSNVGLLGGMIDHPFRYSDDLNRILIVFLILMYPGRFITIQHSRQYCNLRK
jgi:hypothetical protein